MSFFSGSGSKGHYPNNNHGGEYYKRPNGPGGILGRMIDAVTGSGRHSGSNSHRRDRYYPNQRDEHYSEHHEDRHDGYYPDRHRHKSSWS